MDGKWNQRREEEEQTAGLALVNGDYVCGNNQTSGTGRPGARTARTDSRSTAKHFIINKATSEELREMNASLMKLVFGLLVVGKLIDAQCTLECAAGTTCYATSAAALTCLESIPYNEVLIIPHFGFKGRNKIKIDRNGHSILWMLSRSLWRTLVLALFITQLDHHTVLIWISKES